MGAVDEENPTEARAGHDGPGDGDVVDELPEDLDRGFVGPYTFPDNNRRRITGALYVVSGGLVLLLGALVGDGAVLINAGLMIGAAALVALGLFHLMAGYPTKVDENEALVVASRDLGFAVGHASAQLGWRGFTSRPTWRMLVYSSEDPPAQRGMVLVDAVDGGVVDRYVEDNPEDWIETVPGARDEESASVEEPDV